MNIEKQYIKQLFESTKPKLEADNLVYAYYEQEDWIMSKTINGLVQKARRFAHNLTPDDILVLNSTKGNITALYVDYESNWIFPSETAAINYLDTEIAGIEDGAAAINDYYPKYYTYISGPMPNKDGTPGEVRVRTELSNDDLALLNAEVNPNTKNGRRKAVVDYLKENYSDANIQIHPGYPIVGITFLPTIKYQEKHKDGSTMTVINPKSVAFDRKSNELCLRMAMNLPSWHSIFANKFTKDGIDKEEIIAEYSSYAEMVQIINDYYEKTAGEALDPKALPTEAQYQILTDEKLKELYVAHASSLK